METTRDRIPLCDTCPMKDSLYGVNEFPDETLEQARNDAIDVAYNSPTAPWKLAVVLLERGHPEILARGALNCLGNIQRSYCATTDRGYINPDDPNDTTFGAIPRTPSEQG